MMHDAPLLVATVAVVGVLHTIVPDHWAPIVVVGRAQGWSVGRTVRAAIVAGCGHVVSTLILGLLLWLFGAAVAVRYGHLVSTAAAVALIAFGAWIAWTGWREASGEAPDHAPHEDSIGTRTALLLIVGSSPMIEGIPAFFAASTYGPQLLAVMALVFAVSTIVTYAATAGVAIAGLERVTLGPLERYGEAVSGIVVALVGVYALMTA